MRHFFGAFALGWLAASLYCLHFLREDGKYTVSGGLALAWGFIPGILTGVAVWGLWP